MNNEPDHIPMNNISEPNMDKNKSTWFFGCFLNALILAPLRGLSGVQSGSFVRPPNHKYLTFPLRAPNLIH